VAFLALASWAVSGAVLFGPFSAHRGTPIPPRTVVDGKLPIPRYSRLVGVPALVRLVRVGSETPRHWDCSGETCRRVALSDVLPGCSRLQAVNVLTPAVSLCQTIYLRHACPMRCPQDGSYSHRAKTAALPSKPPEQHTPGFVQERLRLPRLGLGKRLLANPLRGLLEPTDRLRHGRRRGKLCFVFGGGD
jgi:hypothetical protein